MTIIGVRINEDGTTRDVTDAPSGDPLETVFHTVVDVAAAWAHPASYPTETAIPVPGDFLLFACLVAECGPENPFGAAVAEHYGIPGLVTYGPVFLLKLNTDAGDDVAFFGGFPSEEKDIVQVAVAREVMSRDLTHA